jgi:hypothetical protein
MSIPLDRLYHYIESVAQEIYKDNIVIYRFYPYGSKKFADLTQLNPDTYYKSYAFPLIYCNDQEPLNYNLYPSGCNLHPAVKKILAENNVPEPENLNFKHSVLNIYDKALLLHSEKNSADLKKYQNHYWIPVYYWAHSIIARDWFRYAEHLQQKKSVSKIFLVYNRAWSGTREYRLGFADRLIMLGLVDSTLMRVSPVDSTVDKHYDLHTFEHPHWRPHNVIEKYFPLCQAESHYSADFDQEDYENTNIEVILETLFDDLRLHLTEKTLRPIAMGQPFMLAATYGSLKYLREYGFKTFSDCWDESYDMMSDSLERMNKIVEVMKYIDSMNPDQREEMLAKAQGIADYNKQHFFSKEFQKLVETELVYNLTQAFSELEDTNTSTRFFNWRKKLCKHNIMKPFFTTIVGKLTRIEIMQLVKKARQYYIRTLSKD